MRVVQVLNTRTEPYAYAEFICASNVQTRICIDLDCDLELQCVAEQSDEASPHV